MHILKNVDEQWVSVLFIDDGATKHPVTGITLANITIKISQINIGSGSPSALTTVTNNGSIVEVGNGVYAVKLTQAETNCDAFILSATCSTTTNISYPVHVWTITNVSTVEADALTQIENQIWDALRADHVTVNTFGEGVLIAPNSTVSITELNGSSAAATNMTAFFTDNVGYHLPYSSVGNTINGIVAAGGSTTVTLDSSASAVTNDLYKNQLIRISDGTGRGQVRLITGYVASTKVATVAPAWAVNPSSGSVYSIFHGAHTNYVGSDALTQIENTVWNATTAGHTTAGTFGAGVILAPTAFANVSITFPGSSGPAANLGQAISMTYQRFYGQVVTDSNTTSIVVKSNDGTVTHSTQTWNVPSAGIIDLGSAS